MPKVLRLATLVAILIGFTVLTIAYSSATPLGEAPDEPTHVQYVLFLRENGRLPRVLGYDDGLPQGKHPPLYYLLGAGLTAGAEFETIGFVRNRHFSHKLDDPPVAAYFVHRDLHGPVDERDAAGRRAVALLRLTSLLSGLLLVVASWWLAREVFPEREELAIAAAASAAFLPGFLFFSGVYNNDALAGALAATALVLAVRLLHGHDRPRDLLMLGTVLGLALLTKLTALPIAVVAGLALVGNAWRKHSGAGETLISIARSGLILALPIVLIFGPWLLRNMLVYGPADPLATKAWSASIGHQLRETPLHDELGTYLWIQFTTFWGRFGWGSVPLPVSVYRFLLLACAMALAGLLTLALLPRLRRGLTPETRWGLALVVAAAAVQYVAVVRLGMRFNLIVAHGRYIYTALSALALLFATGLVAPWPRPVGRVVAVVVAVGMFTLGLWSHQAVLSDAFKPPPSLDETALETLDARLEMRFDDRLTLVGYSVTSDATSDDHDGATSDEHDGAASDGHDGAASAAGERRHEGGPSDESGGDVLRLRSGQAVTVTLYWRSDADFWSKGMEPEGGGVVARDDVAFAHLVARDGEVIARTDAIPLDGTWPTMAWRMGAVYAQPIRLDLPPGQGSVGADLHVGLYPIAKPEARFAVQGPHGPLGDAVVIGPWVVDASDVMASSPPAEGSRAVFAAPADASSEGAQDAGGPVELIASAPRIDGDDLVVTLHWSIAAPLNAEPTVFVHVVAGDGTVIGQSDELLGRHVMPPSLWRTGAYYSDEHRIPLRHGGNGPTDERADTGGSPTDAADQPTVLVGLYGADLVRWSGAPIDAGSAAVTDPTSRIRMIPDFAFSIGQIDGR